MEPGRRSIRKERHMNNQTATGIPTFHHLADAIAAGWMAPRFTGRWTYSRDISGGRSFGYRYALHLRTEEGGIEEREIGRTLTVHFSEDLNQIRQLGCYMALYPPAVAEAARIAAAPLVAAAEIREHARIERREAKMVRKGRSWNCAGIWIEN